jgi:hypothetical protein
MQGYLVVRGPGDAAAPAVPAAPPEAAQPPISTEPTIDAPAEPAISTPVAPVGTPGRQQ